jgi:hypothetical protein
MSDLFAPEGGWRVRIHDMSMPAEENVIEEIGGFETLMHANAFARRYVRASVENCREAAAGGDALKAWHAWGEDAEVVGEGGWRSEGELALFGAQAASGEECDWRAIDPRRLGGDEDDDAPDPIPDGAADPE